MRRNTPWFKLAIAPVLAAALWMAGCSEQGTPADQLLGPETADYAKGLSVKAKGKPTVTVKKSRGSSQYQLVTGVIPDRKDIHESKFIGASGGELKAAGHTLVVPAGAVNRPTEFSIKVSKKVVDHGSEGADDNEVVVGVSLDAVVYDTVVVVDTLGVETKTVVETEVGSKGFLVPVRLSLSYGWAKAVSNAGDLRILWVKKDGTAEMLPSGLDASGKRVSALLDHFSDYAIGFPN